MMQAFPTLCSLLTSLAAATVVACAPSPRTPATAQPAGTALSTAAKQRIGRKIWKNESGGTAAGLTHWNAGEEFPSMGIGHFIWYPKGFRGRWTDRDFRSPRLKSLRAWLANNVSLQTDFIISTSRQALPRIMAAAPPAQRNRIRANYRKVATTPNGTYALIDYVNFKGDGTNPTERYRGQGWGLMWVLMEMKNVPAGQPAAREFAAAAKRCPPEAKNAGPQAGTTAATPTPGH